MFFVDIGDELAIKGNITNAINQGVREGYAEGFLRNSIVDDPIFDRINTGDNTPAVIHYNFVPGNQIAIHYLGKGGGTENCGTIGKLSPSQGERGVIDFVVESVAKAGGKPCPPIIVGVGAGNESELLSKKALLRRIGERNPNPKYAAMEEEILKRVNELDIGPQGLGGKTTALDVLIEYSGAHIATMPIAVSINCHAVRRGSIVLTADNAVRRINEMSKPSIIQVEYEVGAPPMKNVQLPLSEDDVNSLKAGDAVLLSGTIYVARDAAHKRLQQAIENGEELPFNIAGSAIYYMGPTPEKLGNPIGACGPTTAQRMDVYSETMFSNGLRGMIGKGPRTQETIDLMTEHGVVYLSAIGGAGAVYGECVKSKEVIAYEDLGTEAILKLEVKDMPAFVAIDSKGRNLYSQDERSR
jgi:fumarate hydratase class I